MSQRADFTTSDREELVRLLQSAAIIRAGPHEPIVHRDGRPAPWAFYSSNISLTARGMELAGRALLDRLTTFHSTQLAGWGYTAMPLLASCVLLGANRYTALSIRKEPKTYLTRRRVDGPADRTRPVVVIDDSISSGTSLYSAIQALEAEGFEVEGAVALLSFPRRGGAEWAYAHGYRVDSVFDVWRDLNMAPRPSLPAPPIKGLYFGSRPLPPGLPPAVVARRVAEEYLTTGRAPSPPAHLDRAYDGRGGVFVSFRERTNERRVARDGFWHFDPAAAAPCRDLVAATVAAVRNSRGAVSLTTLPSLKVAVTYLGPLEPILPAQLDFDRYGIVVRDTTFGTRLGGALPNTQVFVSEIEQYRHALERNAGIPATEPHVLFRHELVKSVEPGQTWLPYGCADGPHMGWRSDCSLGLAVTDRARQAVAAARDGTEVCRNPLPADLVPHSVCGVAVTIYNGGMLGSGLATDDAPLDTLVCTAGRRAVAAVIATDRPRLDGAQASLVVSILHDPEPMDGASHDLVAMKLRRGLDTLCASTGEGRATILPGAICYNNWTPKDVVARLISAVKPERAVSWTTYRTTSWLRSEHCLQRLQFGFPVRQGVRQGPPDYEAIIELLAGYILRGIGPDGLPTYHVDPVAGISTRVGTSPRLVHALVALGHAGRVIGREGWVSASVEGLRTCLEHVDLMTGSLRLRGHRNGAIGDCVLLAGVAEAGSPLSNHPAVVPLAERIVSWFRPDGRICEHPVRLETAQDHDFLPGAALYAACAHASITTGDLMGIGLDSQLRWSQDRFRLLQTWGMAGWQPQGWAAAHKLKPDMKQASFAFEVADWAIQRQLEKNGAFLEDLSPTEPSFNTGFIAEGVVSAWALARVTGDQVRVARYAGSWERAMDFLRTLVIHPEDTFCFPDPQQAMGGVRTSLTRSDIRIDAVSHVLHALVGGLEQLRECPVPAAAG